MIILQITDIKKTKGNGVAVAVSSYLKYEKKHAEVAIYNLNSNIEIEDIKSFNFKDYNLISNLPSPFNKPDIVVFNEVYKTKYIKLSKECKKNNIPYIIIPHGCLVNTAQRKRKIKKMIGNIFLFNKFINNANAIQFLNVQERDQTKYKIKKYIISGNGIEKAENEPSRKVNKNLIYIGRYSIYHKGLDMLVKVCSKYKKWFNENNIKIQLYGRTTRKDLDKLILLIKKSQVEDILIINGPAYDKEKELLLKNSYGFIQVSRHEGQPMGIIEALAYGIPCIVTPGTTFVDFVNENKCGIGTNFTIDDIFNSIVSLYSCDRNIYAKNAIKAVKKYFYWDNIIEKLINNYNEILYKESNGVDQNEQYS